MFAGGYALLFVHNPWNEKITIELAARLLLLSALFDLSLTDSGSDAESILKLTGSIFWNSSQISLSILTFFGKSSEANDR